MTNLRIVNAPYSDQWRDTKFASWMNEFPGRYGPPLRTVVPTTVWKHPFPDNGRGNRGEGTYKVSWFTAKRTLEELALCMINHEEYLGVYTAALIRSRSKSSTDSDLNLLLVDMSGNHDWGEYVDTVVAFPHHREYPREVYDLLRGSGITQGQYPVLLTNTCFKSADNDEIIFTKGDIREVPFNLPGRGWTTEFDLRTGLPKKTKARQGFGWYFQCEDRNGIQVRSLSGRNPILLEGLISFVNPYEGQLRTSFRGIRPI